jgi:hypothetical protein
MTFNFDDPYHAHAFTALGFVCDACGAGLSEPSAGEVGSDDWCVEYGAQARSARWYVPPTENGYVVDSWTSYCPQCAKKQGLDPDAAV